MLWERSWSSFRGYGWRRIRDQGSWWRWSRRHSDFYNPILCCTLYPTQICNRSPNYGPNCCPICVPNCGCNYVWGCGWLWLWQCLCILIIIKYNEFKLEYVWRSPKLPAAKPPAPKNKTHNPYPIRANPGDSIPPNLARQQAHKNPLQMVGPTSQTNLLQFISTTTITSILDMCIIADVYSLLYGYEGAGVLVVWLCGQRDCVGVC